MKRMFSMPDPAAAPCASPISARAGLLLMAALTILTATPADARQNVSGVWYDDSGKGAIELYGCGPRLCGRIVWLKQPLGKSGQPLRDAYNPSPDRRQRPICGLEIISEVAAQPDGSWDGGSIYDPKVGKSYDVSIERASNNQLRVTGYLGVKLFGKTFVWRRAPQGLPKCSAAS